MAIGGQLDRYGPLIVTDWGSIRNRGTGFSPPISSLQGSSATKLSRPKMMQHWLFL